MSLLWKLLRRHISIAQIAGFALANFIGIFIMLLSIQLYEDVSPILTANDGVFGNDYLVVSKRYTTTGSIFGTKDKSFFSESEVIEIADQPFAESVASFTTSQYKVGCYISIEGIPSMGTDMFFESVPDRYLDVGTAKWRWNVGQDEVPIVLPRSYLTIYNFGFAQTRSLPKLDERTVSRIGLTLILSGSGITDRLRGRVVGFTDKLNSILVPESFMLWSNDRFASSAPAGPTRLIVETSNPMDERIASFMSGNDYEIEDDKLKASQTMFFLRVGAGTLLAVGLLIIALGLYVLVLSIYLLIEKNAYKLQNLMLIGYSRCRVAFPYQLLSTSLNALLFLFAFVSMLYVRSYYMELLWKVFPSISQASVTLTLTVAVSVFVVICIFNNIIIYKKIKRQ